jgi:hypothetical protein
LERMIMGSEVDDVPNGMLYRFRYQITVS